MDWLRLNAPAWAPQPGVELVEDGVTGFVVPKTVEAMVEAVKKVDEIKPRDCRKRVEENFSREVMAENCLEKYREIISGNEW